MQKSTSLIFSNMGVFHHEETPNPSGRCKFLTSTLKDAFSSCHTCGRLSTSSPEQEQPKSEVEDEQEIVVSEIRSRAMEKLRHKPFVITDSFSWVFSPKTGELLATPNKVIQGKEEEEEGDDEEDEEKEENDEREEFFSVGSCFTCCSSALTRDAFLSVKTNFSRCSSLNGFEFQGFPKLTVIQEFCHCEGWPFGLCRKAVLLPPLPKSPSESWTWWKGSRVAKIP